MAAHRILPVVFSLVRPTSVVDVGCGVGTWLRAAIELGVDDVLGCDGSSSVERMLEVDVGKFVELELSRAFSLPRRFDLVISLEVAEHLPLSSAEGFVASLCGAGPSILFSAALPGQGGTNHVNEQPLSWWAAQFRRRGYRLFDGIRPLIWDDALIPVWYRQNIVLFVADGTPLATNVTGPVDIVHPELFRSVLSAETLVRRALLNRSPAWLLRILRQLRRKQR